MLLKTESQRKLGFHEIWVGPTDPNLSSTGEQEWSDQGGFFLPLKSLALKCPSGWQASAVYVVSRFLRRVLKASYDASKDWCWQL